MMIVSGKRGRFLLAWYPQIARKKKWEKCVTSNGVYFKSLFIILPNLTYFFWEKNHHFILVHLVLSNQEEFIAFIYVDDFSIIDNISEYYDSILDASMDAFYKDYAFR